ncbi:leucine-rich repeat extensin-like protein 7 [Iris pallida]|uniref:Leucine-rich repeat extensin-like protein 7 n=1 Tax=Iris pallida TaxID=29817 RepID=A0AAX6H3S7_IRIPA|nr:leucine-rich repeat extensin-like protein 7 [Iris pallida]
MVYGLAGMSGVVGLDGVASRRWVITEVVVAIISGRGGQERSVSAEAGGRRWPLGGERSVVRAVAVVTVAQWAAAGRGQGKNRIRFALGLSDRNLCVVL